MEITNKLTKMDQETKTTLSGEIWRLKRIRPDYDFDLKFSVLVLAKAYNREIKNVTIMPE